MYQQGDAVRQAKAVKYLKQQKPKLFEEKENNEPSDLHESYLQHTDLKRRMSAASMRSRNSQLSNVSSRSQTHIEKPVNLFQEILNIRDETEAKRRWSVNILSVF